MRSPLLATIVALTACTSTPTDPTDDAETDTDAADTEVPTTGRLAIRFQIDPFVRDAMPEGEDPVGKFDGSVWRAEDVTVIGPDEGAEDLEGLDAEVDLVASNPSPVLITTDELPVGYVRILGFLDTDGNAGSPPRPDDKDPVTLPEQNEFEVVGGVTTEVTVTFGLLNP